MRCFFLIVLGVFCLLHSYSQQAFAQRESDTAKQQLEDLINPNAQSRDPQDIRDYAALEYQRCESSQHPIIAGKHKDNFCSCVSKNVPKVMSFEQMQAVQNNTNEGLYQNYRLMMFAYAPCIRPSLMKMIQFDCFTNRKNKYLMKNQDATCTCLAKGVSTDFEDRAEQTLKMAMERSLRPDPLMLFVNDKAFDIRFTYHSRVCTQTYER